ncbi:MAG: hypothetical protein M1839_006034 [Geoglossum umbratile]|nr:MAG: hypothetical protein M1839_006034 [Geoglossum umbratile]
MSSVADRRNQQIWDAIENDNLKQALQLCTKRLKKGEKGDYLLALKAHVLTLSISRAQNDEGFADAHALASKVPPITDVEVLRLLQLALSNLEARGDRYNAKESIAKLWERAIKAKPGDEALAREWFLKTFQDRDWRSAQKAAMSLQKTYSKKREYYFWAVLSCYLLCVWMDATESERKIFGALAYRMISKAASDVPDDPEILLSPGRAIQTPHELHLLLSVYRQQGYKAEALGILDSNNSGVSSAAAKGDWSFVREKLDLLEELGIWEMEWDFCKMLLDEASPRNSGNGIDGNLTAPDTKGDDWRVWQGLLVAARGINGEENRKSTIDTIQLFIDQSRTSRNARLALLDYLVHNSSAGQPVPAPPDLISACQSHFETFSTKTCCFDDMRCYVEYLEQSQRKDYLEHCRQFAKKMLTGEISKKEPKVASIAALVNILKFEYLIDLSLDSDPTSIVAEDFIVSCISIYKSSLPLSFGLEPTDTQYGDDSCILAAMSLVRLANSPSGGNTFSHSRGYLLQAAALLEFLVSRSRHNFQAILLLVRLYGLLGACSLAMEASPRLSIKQIQNDTLAHNIFSRISTLHPYQVVGLNHLEKGDRDPSLGLLKALMVYEKSAAQIPDLAKMALEKGSVDQVEGFLEFADKVRNSICKVMWTLERRRIARLIRTKSSSPEGPDFDHIEPLPYNITDNRDYEVMISCEGSKLPRFEEFVRVGPKPMIQWARAFHCSEQLSLYLATKSNSLPEDQLRHLQEIGDISDTFKELLNESNDALSWELTDSEKQFVELQALLAEELKLIAGAESNLKDVVNDGLQRVMQWLDKRLEAADVLVQGVKNLHIQTNDESTDATGLLTRIPDWKLLHESYTTFEALNSISAYTRFIDTRTKVPKSPLPKATTSAAKQRIDTLYQAVRARAAGIKNQLSESGVVSALVDSAFGREGKEEGSSAVGTVIEGLVGESWMEMHVARVIESWQEGLDGVLRVKLQ